MLTPEESAELRSLQTRAYAPGGGLSDEDAARLGELEEKRVAKGAPAGAPAPSPGLRRRVRLEHGASREAGDTTEAGGAEDLAALLGFVEPASSAGSASREGPSVRSPGSASLGDSSLPSAGSASLGDSSLPSASSVSPADSSLPFVERAPRSGASRNAPTSEDVEDHDTAPAERPPRGIRALLRRRWVPYAATAIALLLGVGVGWLVFGRGVEQIAFTAANAAKQAELNADGQFDPGSVVPVGEKYGATVWRATSGEGESECVIVTHGDSEGRGCAPREEFEANGVFVSVEVPRDDEEARDQISAGIMFDIDGQPVVIVQSWMSYGTVDWRSQYSEDELVVADRLVAGGYQGESLQILGYDGETPVWMDWSGVELCVIVALPDRIQDACGDISADAVALPVDAGDGSVTTYVVTQSEMRGPMLTIERDRTASLDDKTGRPEGD